MFDVIKTSGNDKNSLEDEATALGLGGDDDNSEEGEESDEDSKKKKKKSKNSPDENVGKKNKKLLKGADLIEAKGRGEWLPGKEKLVEKRPPRVNVQ